MKTFFVLLLLAAPGFAEDWTAQLSPRMREAFKDMIRDDWKPQKAAQLTEREKREWTEFWQYVEKNQAPGPPPLAPQPPKPPEGK